MLVCFRLMKQLKLKEDGGMGGGVGGDGGFGGLSNFQV